MGIFSIIVGAVDIITKALAVAELAVEGLKTLGRVIVSAGQKLGLIPSETNAEELGEKALQLDENGEGYNPENETYKEYMNRIDKFEIDPEKKHEEKEALEKGIAVSSGAIIDEFPDCSDLLEAVVLKHDKLDLKDGELEKYIQSDISKDIANHIKGTEKNGEITGSVVEEIVSIQKQLDPGMSDMDAYRRARGMHG